MNAGQMDIRMLRGVGETRARTLAKMGIATLEDLLLHYPRGYIDLSAPCGILDAPLDRPCAVLATVIKKSGEIRTRGGLKMYKATVADDSGEMELTFFNTKYAVESLDYDAAYLFYGRVEGNLLRREMRAPQIFPPRADRPFFAVYPLTAGVSARTFSGLVEQALKLSPILPERIPADIRAEYRLEEISGAVRAIHRPQNSDEIETAKRRLIFEELFTLAAGVGLLRTRTRAAAAQPMEPHSLQPFYDALPFTLTGAQRRAIEELTADMRRSAPANRLVQGDVGSGKTMVAAAGAYFAFLSGAQSAMMAPTELLARQHYEGLSPLCGRLGMKVGLLVGSMTPAKKRAMHEALAAGEFDLCIGTHALLSQGVSFQNLALVITDEQHRFGVAQRAALGQKGRHAHTLVMSATPIPRTLALMIYGELDVSVIDELPPGRSPVLTYKISSGKRERAFGFIREHLDRGLQAYIVCPRVEAGEEDTGLRAATDYMLELSGGAFKGYTVGLLHGRMKAADKERTMAGFQDGTVQLLVSTTVVEVGVDVPNAVIMMVENAERFGLSQLHQLRGRVGRGKEQSYCILLSDSTSPETLDRLKTMCRTNDGFAIAEYDLRTRGPGNFLGQQQHGLPQLRIADLATDVEVVAEAQRAANRVLADDPALQKPEHAALRAAVERLMDSVGERPN
ncbi:ATP-dependent DNA helicase RecG [Anaerotruncus sp. DFI.9.16]|uniref:ATP-dependent DNA helicase RecG n=1 Tax=Anaerotruncus sp. DFI.9.16 TaxID=2965275 RepID=UPI003521A39D